MDTQRTLLADRLLVTHRVSSADHGSRLDTFLKRTYRKRTRNTLKKAISTGSISIQRPHLQSGKIKPSTQVCEGDIIEILSVKKAEPRVDFSYRLLYQDDAIAIVDKPACLPVHPAGKYFFNTLLTHLRTQGFTQPLCDENEYFLVHRIDRETSGILILTRRSEYCTHLMHQFSRRETEKTYLAIVHGQPNEKQFSITSPLGRKPQSRVRVKMFPMPLEAGGLSAHTDVQWLESYGAFSLLECRPKTGRQHQIRAHLASAGFPLVGDKLYGVSDEEALQFFDPPRRHKITLSRSPSLSVHQDHLPDRILSPELESKLILKRHALHAAEIRFRHPLTNKWMHFKSELAPDLQDFLNRQRSVSCGTGAVFNMIS